MRPTEVLEQEHRTIEALLDRLELAAVTALRTEALDLALVRKLVHMLSVLLDRWHRQKEEALLFPLIEERGVGSTVIRAAFLMEEHDPGQAQLRAMEADLHRPARMGATARVAFCHRVITFADRVRQHMRMEEEIVFPLAEALLCESDRAMLLLAFDRIEKLDPFPGTREEIRKLLGDPSPATLGSQHTANGSSSSGDDHQAIPNGAPERSCHVVKGQARGRHEPGGRRGWQNPALARPCG